MYILTNQKVTTFYIGVTNNLERRVYEHRQKLTKGFTSKYNLTKLIYYEEYPTVIDALTREKQLKNWHREWKINLIKSLNPKFEELFPDPETSSG